jgi:hypothetical protein
MSEKVISQAIRKADIDLRTRYPFLNNQDVLGAVVFLGSFVGIFTTWLLYFAHSENYMACGAIILTIALLTSFLHELEHDLIHNLYFKKVHYIQDVMFFGIWIAKLHGNPWFRRDLHLKHHIISGQLDDAEERLIGLGIPFGFERMAVTMHPFGSLIITPAVSRDAKWLNVQKLNLTSAPVAFFFFSLNKLWFLYVITMLVVGYDNYHLYLPARHWWWIRASAVLLCLPNMWRQACLVLMSNCSHYYGDIPEKSVFYQNQILDHWLVWPFQLFCVNFGKFLFCLISFLIMYVYSMLVLFVALFMTNIHSLLLWYCNAGATHIVHHYVPGQPFYIRELVYRRVKDVMIAQGVRYNDLGIVRRGNRYFDCAISPLSASVGARAATDLADVDPDAASDTSAAAAANPTTGGGDAAATNSFSDKQADQGATKTKQEEISRGRSVSPNNSGVLQMLMWVGLNFTVGAACYIVFDVWAMVAMTRRIIRKYVRRVKSE